MRRFVAGLLFVSTAAALSSGSGLPVAGAETTVQSRAASVTPWPQLGFDAARDGFNPSETRLGTRSVRRLVAEWSASPSLYCGETSPAIVDGVAYAGCTTNGGEGVLVAVDAATGSVLWSSDLGVEIASSPAVSGGLVYVGTKNSGTDSSFFAVNVSDGSVAWHRALGAVVSSPVVANGIVYVGSYGTQTVYALDAATGSTVWSSPSGYGPVQSSPAVVNGVLYIGADNNAILAFGAATGGPPGLVLTTRPHRSPTNAIVVADGVLYTIAGTDLYAVDIATHQLLWRFSHRWLGGEPAVANGVLYTATFNYSVGGGGVLFAINASTGAALWHRNLPTATGGSPSVANGVVYAGAFETFNASTGHRIWTANLEAAGTPAVSDGSVYLDGDGVTRFSVP